MTSAASTGHKHTWQPLMHLDNCHSYEWRYACACGATRRTWAERDIGADPYSAVWMSREDDEEPCVRCEQLMSGAKPEHGDTISEAASWEEPLGD